MDTILEIIGTGLGLVLGLYLIGRRLRITPHIPILSLIVWVLILGGCVAVFLGLS